MGFWKNIIDYSGGVILLLLFLPLLIILSFTIALRYRCSPIFSQIRIGKLGKSFRIYKLRTIDSHNIPSKDGFVKFLRRTNIDELPQVLNVIKGEMSLVGPRPHLAEHVARYKPWQRERLSVKPGITGLRQITESRKLEFNELLELDISYINHSNVSMDTKILLKTGILQLQKIWQAIQGNPKL